MNDQAPRTASASEDIDLLVLAERCIIFFKKYRILFITATLIGLLSGLLLYKKIATTYTSRLLLHSSLLSNPEAIQIVGSWYQLLTKGEKKELANQFQCDPSILTKTKKIKAKEVQQVFNANNPNGFIVEATVTDNEILDSLQQAIVNGFENSVYVKERLATRRSALREMIEKLTSEISKLDSVKSAMADIIGGKGRSSSSVIIDGSRINQEWIDMNEKLYSLREQLQFMNAAQVLQGFQHIKEPAGPHLIPLLVIGVLFFLALAYGLAILHSVNARLKNRTRIKGI
jgi:hypothetical protein